MNVSVLRDLKRIRVIYGVIHLNVRRAAAVFTADAASGHFDSMPLDEFRVEETRVSGYSRILSRGGVHFGFS